MAFIDTVFKAVTRAAVVAVALGATILVAAPAFAQSGSSSLSIEIQSNGGGRGFDNDRHMDRNNGWRDSSRRRCLSNREVVRGASAYGYDRVEITRELQGERADLQAVKGNWIYTMRVDKCSGEIDRLQRVGRAFGGHRGYDGGGRRDGGCRNDGGFDGGGFGFQFNFGN
ncbi:MAG: hypothetical protein MO852_09535 [Candidatus Devosia euplotis]|nr:hypothetical protein [Candidatus Devosia euplotis]